MAKEKDVTEVPYFAYGEREREREMRGRVGGGGEEGERGWRERKGHLSNNKFIIADHQESFKS